MKRSKVSQRIQVAVRIRPRHRLAILEDGKSEIEELLTVHGRTITLAGSGFGVAQALAYDDDATSREKNSHHFTFDHVVDSREDDRHSPNNKIFECVGKPIVPHLLDGYNACVLAYGQTGSGKTFTMMGARYGGGAIKSVGASSRRGTLVLPGQTPAESLNVSSIAEDTAGGVNEEDMAARIDSGDGLIPRIVASLFSQFCPDNQDNDADTNNAFFMSPSGVDGGATPLPSARGTNADFGMVDGGETPRVTEAFTPRPMPHLRRRHVNVLIECSIVELYSESPACLISRYTVQKSKRLAKGGGGGGKDTKPLVEPQCEVRESLEEGPHVQGAAKVTLYDSTRAGITAMEAAREAVAFVHNVVTTTRHVSSTLQNEVSSRSHVIITFFVTQKEWVLGQPGKRSNGTVVVTKSRVQLVDLAGSERVGAHGLVDPIFMPPTASVTVNDDSASEINIRGTTLLMSPGIDTSAKKASKASMLGILSPSGVGAGGNTQFGEGIKINKSLLTLGRIVEMLASKGKGKHDGGVPPFRDSKLTFILKPSLGGDSLTSIVACVHAPLRNTARAADALTDYYHETLNTLQFANRAKNIGLHASSHKQIDSRSLEVAALVAENNQLREQLQEMQSHVASLVMMKNSSYGSLLSPMNGNDNNAAITNGNNALTITKGEEEDASPGRWSDILAPKPPQANAASGTVVARQNQSFELPPTNKQREGAAVEALLLPVAPVALSRERNGDRTLAYRLDYRPERLRLLEIVFEDDKKRKSNANGSEEENFDVSSSSSSSSSSSASSTTSTGRELSDAEEEEHYVRDAAQSLQHEYDMVEDSPHRTASTTKKQKKNSEKKKSIGDDKSTANELSTPVVHGPSLRADNIGELLYPDASPSSAVTKANRALTKKSIRMPFTLRNRRLSASAPTCSMIGWVRTKPAAEPSEDLTEGVQQQQQQRQQLTEDNDFNNNGALLHYLEIPIAILEASHMLHNGSSPLYTIAVDGAKVLPPPTTNGPPSVPLSSFVSVALFSGSIISISLPKSILAEGSVSRYSFQYVISDRSSRRMGRTSTMPLLKSEFIDRPLPLTASALIAGSQMGLHVDANDEFYSGGGADGSPTVRQLYLRMSASASPDRAAYNQHISPSANRKSMRATKLAKDNHYNNGKGDARFSLNDEENAVFGSLIASAVAARAPSVTVRELSVALHDPLVRPREGAALSQLYEGKNNDKETNAVEPLEIRFDETSVAIRRHQEDPRLSGTTTQERKTIFNRPTTTTTAAVVNARNIGNMNSKDYGLRRTNVDFDASPTAAIAIESIDMAEMNTNTNNNDNGTGDEMPAAVPSAVVVAATESVVFNDDAPTTDFSSALAFYESNGNGRDGSSGGKRVFEMDVGGVRRRFDDADKSGKSAAAVFAGNTKRGTTNQKLPSSSFSTSPSSSHHHHHVKDDNIDADVIDTPRKRGGASDDNNNGSHKDDAPDQDHQTAVFAYSSSSYSPRPTVLESDHRVQFDELVSEGGRDHRQEESPARYDEGSPYRWAPAIQSIRAEVEMVLAEECEHLAYRASVSAATSPHRPHHRNRIAANDGDEDRGEVTHRQRSASRGARKSNTSSKSRNRGGDCHSWSGEEGEEEDVGAASSKSCSPNTIKSLQQTVMNFELNGTLSGSVAVVPPEQQEYPDAVGTTDDTNNTVDNDANTASMGLNDDSLNGHSASSSFSSSSLEASSGSEAGSSSSMSSSYSSSSLSSSQSEDFAGDEEGKGRRKRNANTKKKSNQQQDRNKNKTHHHKKQQPYTFNTLTSMMQTLRTATDPSVCPTLQREIHSALMQLYPPCLPLPVGEVGNYLEGYTDNNDEERDEEEKEERIEDLDEREKPASSSVRLTPTAAAAAPTDNVHRPNLLHSLLFDEVTLKSMLCELQEQEAKARDTTATPTAGDNATIASCASSKILAKLLGRHLFLIDGYWLWLCREVIHAKLKKNESDRQGEGEEESVGNEEEEIRVRGFLLQAEERRTPTNAFRVRSPTLDLPFGGDLIALLSASTDINFALSSSSPTGKEKKRTTAVLQPPPPINFTPAPLSKILELLHRMQQVSTWTSDAINAALTNTVDAVMAKVKVTAPLLLLSSTGEGLTKAATVAEIIEEKRQQVQSLVESFIHDLPVTSCPITSTLLLSSGNPPPPPTPSIPISRLIRCSDGGRPSDTFSFFSENNHSQTTRTPLLAFAELYSTSFSPAPAADNGVGIRVKVVTNITGTHHDQSNGTAATMMTLPWVDWNFSSRDPLLISSEESVTAIAQSQLRLLPEIARLREALMALALPPAATGVNPAKQGQVAQPSPPPAATTTSGIAPSTHTHTQQIDVNNTADSKAPSPFEEDGVKATTAETVRNNEIPHRHHVDPSSSVGDVVNDGRAGDGASSARAPLATTATKSSSSTSTSSSLTEGQKMLLRLRKEKGLPTIKKQPQAQQEVVPTDKHLFVSTDVMEVAKALLEKTAEERLGKLPRSAGASNKNPFFFSPVSSPSIATGRLARTQSFVSEALLRSPLTRPSATSSKGHTASSGLSVSSPAVVFEPIVATTTTSTTAATNDPQAAALRTLTASALVASLVAELQRTKAETEEANAALQSEVTTAIVIKDQLQRSLAAAEHQLTEERKRADEAVADTNHKFAILEADYEAATYSHGKLRQQLEAQMRLTDNLQALVEDREELIKRLRSDAEDRKQENDMLSLQVAVLKRDLARAHNVLLPQGGGGVGETEGVVSPPQHTSGGGVAGQEEGSRPLVVEGLQQSPSPRRRIVIPTSSSSRGVGTLATDVHNGAEAPNKESVSCIAQSIANAVVKGMPTGSSLTSHSPRTANVRAKTAQTAAKSTALTNSDGADQRKKAEGQGNERSMPHTTAAARESETYCEAEDGGRKRTSVGSPNLKPSSKHAGSSKSPNDAARNSQSQQREDGEEESRSPRRLPPSTTGATLLGGEQTLPVAANGSLAPSPMGARRTCTVALSHSVPIGSSPTSAYLKRVGLVPQQASPHRRLASARATSPKAVTQLQTHSLSETDASSSLAHKNDQQKPEVAGRTNNTTKVPSPADGTTRHAVGASPSPSISFPNDAASCTAAESESEQGKGVTALADTIPAPKEKVVVGSLQKYNNTVSGHVSNLRLVNKAAKKQQPEKEKEEEDTPLPQEGDDGSAEIKSSSITIGTNTINKALGLSGKFIPNNRRPAIDDPHTYLFLEYQKTQHELKEAIKLIESKDELFAREKARLERESEERAAEIARLSNEMQTLADKLVQRDHRIPLKGTSGSGTATPLQQGQQSQQSAAALMSQASSTLLDRCRRRRSSSTSSCPNAAQGGGGDFSRTPTGDGAQQQQQKKTSSATLPNSTTALASSYKLRTPAMALLNQARPRAPSANNTKGRVIGGGANTAAQIIQSPAANITTALNDEGLVNTPAPAVATFSARASKPQQEGAASRTAEGAVSTPSTSNPQHTIVVSASGLPPLVIEHRLAEVKKELQRSTREKDKYRKMLDERDGQILALMTELRTAKTVASQAKPRSSSNSGSGALTRSPRSSMTKK